MEKGCVLLAKGGQRQQHRQEQQTEYSDHKYRGEVIVDATHCIAGRLCSHVSKLLLKGNRVSIVGAENAMLSGNRYMTIDLYKKYLEISSVTNPIHGPLHPRRPDTILTRMVRGMIPKKKTSGIEAFKRLRVYIGVPDEIRGKKLETFQDAKISRSPSKYISVGEVAKQIGWGGVLRNDSKQQPKQKQVHERRKSEIESKADQKDKKPIRPSPKEG